MNLSQNAKESTCEGRKSVYVRWPHECRYTYSNPTDNEAIMMRQSRSFMKRSRLFACGFVINE